MSESLTPWRARLAEWPLEWRERWGLRANQLEDTGLDWIEAEKLAWNEVIVEKAAATRAA